VIRLPQQQTEPPSLSTTIGRMVLSGAIDALNAIQQPAVAIDRSGCVIDTNPLAEALFDDHIRISIKDRRLHIGDAEARSALEILYSRLRTASDLTPLPCEPIVVRRRDNGPIILRTLPAPADALGARALMTLTPVAPRPGPQATLLAGVFGLSPAEARLASIIAEGRNPEHAAKELGIRTATVRNQLKSIFSKTSTCRQSELVALLLRV
jgi:DNA-binding CsgD family transcriptional regulator